MRYKRTVAISFLVIILLVSLSVYIIIKVNSTPPTNIARFSQDTTQDMKVRGYQIIEYDINRDISGIVNNIWITYNFSQNKNHSSKLKEYLDRGSTILVQGDNIEFIPIYEALNIPIENRASKSIPYLGEHKFYTRGILIFKHKDFYYVKYVRFEHLDYPKDFYKELFYVFRTDKMRMVYLE